MRHQRVTRPTAPPSRVDGHTAAPPAVCTRFSASLAANVGVVTHRAWANDHAARAQRRVRVARGPRHEGAGARESGDRERRVRRRSIANSLLAVWSRPDRTPGRWASGRQPTSAFAESTQWLAVSCPGSGTGVNVGPAVPTKRATSTPAAATANAGWYTRPAHRSLHRRGEDAGLTVRSPLPSIRLRRAGRWRHRNLGTCPGSPSRHSEVARRAPSPCRDAEPPPR
jgi:hypothetical protein